MKTSPFIIAAAIISLSLPLESSNTSVADAGVRATVSKPNTTFNFLRTHRQGKGVTATWGMATTDDIVGFTVQRTYEDPTDPYANWEDLATIPYHSSRSFRYRDGFVFPGLISYRIVAILDDTHSITSEISSIRIRSRR